MKLTKQQEKDIKRLIELSKQLPVGEQRCNAIPGIDIEFDFEEDYGKFQILDFTFILTDKNNKKMEQFVEMLNQMLLDDFGYFESIEGVRKSLDKFNKILKKVKQLKEKICLDLREKHKNILILIDDCIIDSQDYDLFINRLNEDSLEEQKYDDIINEIVKQFEQIKKSEMKNVVVQILENRIYG